MTFNSQHIEVPDSPTCLFKSRKLLHGLPLKSSWCPDGPCCSRLMINRPAGGRQSSSPAAEPSSPATSVSALIPPTHLFIPFLPSVSSSAQADSLEMKLHLVLLLLGVCRLGVTCLPEEPSPAAPHVNGTVDEDEDDSDPGCGATFGPEQHRAIGGAVEQLGLRLLENLPISPQQPNVILSPLSLALALAQLTLGARNETERLLLQSLHALRLPCVHHILGSLVPHFSHKSVELAARMYLKPGFDVKISFVEDSLSRYKSQPVPLVSVEEVNQWVENVTNGHIASFLESIPHDVVLMLINAVHFKGEWQTRFDPSVTSKGVFYLDSQNSVPVDMMKSAQYPLRLLDDPELEAQVASFPFKANTSFLVVLPRGNVSSLLPKLNISDLYRRLPQEKTMQVNLPKVKLQYRQELQEALTRMGLGSLFSAPNLSGISDFPLKVTGVRHASTVELSEDGVEASATTAVTSMRSVSLFSVNSPFVFALVDDASLAPLFMGVVTNPAPDHDPMLRDDPHSNSNGNATMSDQPATDRKTDTTGGQHVETVEDSSLPPCSAPSGGKHGNELQKKTQDNETCLKPDDPVPA